MISTHEFPKIQALSRKKKLSLHTTTADSAIPFTKWQKFSFSQKFGIYKERHSQCRTRPHLDSMTHAIINLLCASSCISTAFFKVI